MRGTPTRRALSHYTHARHTHMPTWQIQRLKQKLKDRKGSPKKNKPTPKKKKKKKDKKGGGGKAQGDAAAEKEADGTHDEAGTPGKGPGKEDAVEPTHAGACML